MSNTSDLSQDALVRDRGGGAKAQLSLISEGFLWLDFMVVMGDAQMMVASRTSYVNARN